MLFCDSYGISSAEGVINHLIYFLRGIVAEPHKWCGTDFLDLASLDPCGIPPHGTLRMAY